MGDGMRTIYKYILDEPENTIITHEESRVLHINTQHDNICVWIEVDNETPKTRTLGLYLVGTGCEIPSNAIHYYGTALIGAFVFHVYEAS